MLCLSVEAGCHWRCSGVSSFHVLKCVQLILCTLHLNLPYILSGKMCDINVIFRAVVLCMILLKSINIRSLLNTVIQTVTFPMSFV